MEKYVAIPVEVEAAVIEDTRNWGILEVKLDGHWFPLPEGAAARHEPIIGDYYVRQSDGYVYINPKHVFERKYRRFEDTLTLPSKIEGAAASGLAAQVPDAVKTALPND